jgi:hypothetical protein
MNLMQNKNENLVCLICDNYVITEYMQNFDQKIKTGKKQISNE